MIRSHSTPLARRVATFLALTALLGGFLCGPDLTTPGAINVTGTWHSTGPAAGMTDITIVLNQEADGSVTGTFTATGTSPNQACPSVAPCLVSSKVRGANTILQIDLELQGGGTFTGQVMTPTRIHGTMTAAQSELTDFEKVSAP